MVNVGKDKKKEEWERMRHGRNKEGGPKGGRKGQRAYRTTYSNQPHHHSLNVA